MKQTALWAIVIILALAVGLGGGWFLSRSQNQQAINDLQQQVSQLQSEVGQTSSTPASNATSSLKHIAVVGVNDLALRYQDQNPAVKTELQQKYNSLQQQYQQVQTDLQNKKISQAEAETQMSQLQSQLQDLLLTVVAKPIQDAVSQVAQTSGYDMVFKKQDVVIYSKPGLLDDITEQVWTQLKSTINS